MIVYCVFGQFYFTLLISGPPCRCIHRSDVIYRLDNRIFGKLVVSGFVGNPVVYTGHREGRLGSGHPSCGWVRVRVCFVMKATGTPVCRSDFPRTPILQVCRIFFNDQLLTTFWFTLKRRNRKNNLLIIDEKLLLTHDTQMSK
jgi:hypothetical protein